MREIGSSSKSEIKWAGWRNAGRDQKEKIKNWYLEGFSTPDIADFTGLSPATIGKWLERLGIEKRNRSESIHIAKSGKIRWSKEDLKVIRGELLGDGCLSKEPRSRNYSFYLSTSVKEHALHLRNILPENLFSPNVPWKARQNWKMSSRTDKKLTNLRKLWYPKDVKRVPCDLKLTPTTSHYWYVGDGNLEKYKDNRNSGIRISTECFPLEDVKLLCSMLSNEGYRTTIQRRRKKGQYRIRISTYDTPSFLMWIGKPKIEAYAYKWGL